MKHQEKLDFILNKVSSLPLENGVDYYIFKELMACKIVNIDTREEIHSAGMGLCLQGKERIIINNEVTEHEAGILSASFIPTPISLEILEASEDKPFYALGMFLNEERLSKVLLKISKIEKDIKVKSDTFSALTSGSIDNLVLDAFYRLMKIIDKPIELEVLGDSLVDEIYFRVLYNQEHEIYKHLLNSQSQFTQISSSIDYIHSNLNRIITVDELADKVNMSVSGYHKKFKDVMHMSPLQYVKSIKLDRAQALLTQGKNVSQTADLVGYNSLAQFSREYKRHFNVLPSKI